MAWYNPFSWFGGRQSVDMRSTSDAASHAPMLIDGADSLIPLLPAGALERSQQIRRVIDLPNGQKSLTVAQLFSGASDGRPLFKNWTEAAAIRGGYKASTWFFACVYAMSKAVGSVPWVTERGSDEKWETVPNHPLTQLIRRPNEFWTCSDLHERIILHQYLGGNALATKIRSGIGNVAVSELWLHSPDKIKPIESNTEFIAGYQPFKDGRPFGSPIPNEDIVHFQIPDPADPRWGMPIMQAIHRAIDSDVEQLTWQQQSMKNRAVPSGAILFDHDLTEEQHKFAKSKVEEEMTGPERAQIPLVLGNRAKWAQFSLSPVEMDFLNSRGFTREEICAGTGVPPTQIGIYDKATLNQIREARLIFWQDRVIPALTSIRDRWNRNLTPEFGDDIRLNYDLRGVPAMRRIFLENLEAATKLFAMGYPPDEINARLNLGMQPQPNGAGQIGYLPANVMPAGVTLNTSDGGMLDDE